VRACTPLLFPSSASRALRSSCAATTVEKAISPSQKASQMRDSLATEALSNLKSPTLHA
jgi:hypothetical protein